MKKLIVAIIMLCGLTYLWSCEKDDICPEDTPTTPNLVVELYNTDNRTELNPADSLIFYVEGSEKTVRLANVTSFELPLPVNAETVTWNFTKKKRITGGPYSPNTDKLVFKYTVQEEYISRACGYRNTFTLEPGTNLLPNPAIEDGDGADGLWIDDVDVTTRFITTDQDGTVHIKIYFTET